MFKDKDLFMEKLHTYVMKHPDISTYGLKDPRSLCYGSYWFFFRHMELYPLRYSRSTTCFHLRRESHTQKERLQRYACLQEAGYDGRL